MAKGMLPSPGPGIQDIPLWLHNYCLLGGPIVGVIIMATSPLPYQGTRSGEASIWPHPEQARLM